jgi:plastocyanin
MAGALAAAALAAAPTVASADEVITAGPTNQFTTPSVTIDQGEKLTFKNNDFNTHNVTSNDSSTLPGSVNGHLFASRNIGNGQSAPVEGSQYLRTGSYGFFCSLHPFMTGTLNVNSAGTPVPRPADGGGGGGGGGAPELTVKVRGSNLDKVVDSRRLKVKVLVDEKVTVDLKAKVKGVGTVAKKSDVPVEAGGKTVKLKLRRKARRELGDRSRAKLKLSAVATDAQGAVATDTARKTLR